MLRLSLCFVLFLFFAVQHVYAQESQNTITVIQKDGTKQSVDIKPAQKNAPDSPVFKKSAPKGEPEPIKNESSADIEDRKEGIQADKAVNDITENVENDPQKPDVTQTDLEPNASVTPESIQEKKPAKAKAKVKAAKAPMIKPRRKPLRQIYEVENVDEGDAQPQQRAPISQSLALSLAIDDAPPSGDFEIFRAMQDDLPIYQVLFKTDNGPYEVQVDAFDGVILFSDYRTDIKQYTTPAGHLPSRLLP